MYMSQSAIKLVNVQSQVQMDDRSEYTIAILTCASRRHKVIHDNVHYVFKGCHSSPHAIQGDHQSKTYSPMVL